MSAVDGGFDQLLDRLGYGPDDEIVVCHQPVGRGFTSTRTTVADAAAVADGHAADDVWFSVNPVADTGSGRGKATDVTRLAALWADLDFKAGGMGTSEKAHAAIGVVSEMLGTCPVAVVSSGHGLQPYWAIEVDDPSAKITDDNRGDAIALLRRFGRLVAHVASVHHGKVDSVFDLARVMRVPGTVNHKAEPVAVTMTPGTGHPLTIAESDEALTAYGATEQPGDREVVGAVIAPVDGWEWARSTDPAVARAVASWGQQTPPGRHPWLLGCLTSLALAWRLGMVTDVDYSSAVDTVTGRFAWLLANDAIPRAATPGEVADCMAFSVAKAASKTDPDARADWEFWCARAADCDADLGRGDHADGARDEHVDHDDHDGGVHDDPHGGDGHPDDAGTSYEFTPGGSFILDTPADPEPLWGSGSEVLLPDGEALIIAGGQGLGKTTLAQQLALGRCGFGEYADLLGYPIKPGERRVLYLAMDRPRQAARSFRRMVGEAWREELDQRLSVWQGPPPNDLAKYTGLLLDLCRKADADTVVVDSMKDAAIGLTDDEVGAGYNRARQTASREGVQIVECHHNRKAVAGAKSVLTIEDLYGSIWLPAGAGSVILLTGAPGDPIVGLRHLKQPADEVGPFKVIHDHSVGRSEVWHAADLLEMCKVTGGLSAIESARALFDTAAPSLAQKEKARRRLEKLERGGALVIVQHGDQRANLPTRWGSI